MKLLIVWAYQIDQKKGSQDSTYKKGSKIKSLVKTASFKREISEAVEDDNIEYVSQIM